MYFLSATVQCRYYIQILSILKIYTFYMFMSPLGVLKIDTNVSVVTLSFCFIFVSYYDIFKSVNVSETSFLMAC